MKKTKRKNLTKHEKELYSVIETILETETIIQMIENSYYEKSMKQADNSDVDINHLENIFTNETYYLAMKMIPLLERKVLYLSYIENVRLNDICRRLKLQKKEIVTLRNKGINHFKHNLEILEKANRLKKGGLKNES